MHTASSATCARLAISEVSCWSQSFHPRRRASSQAMAAPPLPNSRSSVMMRNIRTLPPRARAPAPHLIEPILVNDHPSRFRLLDQKYARNQAADHDPEYPEIINVGQHRRLPDNIRLQHGMGMLLSRTASGTGSGAAT